MENREIPDTDVFSYTTPLPLSGGQKTGMQSQWLGQVIYYTSYLLGGYAGIGILRNALIVLPMLLIYIWLVEKGLKPLTAVIAVSLASLMFAVQVFYAFERPQGISFYLSLVVIVLLERLRQNARHGEKGFDVSYLMLPAVMVFWSNIHAGYIIGNGIVMVYMFTEVLRFAWRRLKKKETETNIKAFFIFSALSIAASAINPGGYKMFWDYLYGTSMSLVMTVFQSVKGTPAGEAGWVTGVVLEYKSLYYFYKYLEYKWLVFFWAFNGGLFLFLFLKYWLRRSVDLAELGVVSGITLFANYHARGLMFALVILSFYMAKTLVELNTQRLRHAFRGAVAFCLALTIAFTTYSYKRLPFVFKPGVTPQWVTPWYPIHATRFLKATNIPGPMYNFYTWGGFLIWTVYPQYKVFIDGRALDDMVNRTADAILKTFPGWKEKLDAYSINFIVVPVVFRESGHAIPIATTLAKDPEWKLIFLRYNSAIFIRNIPQNRSVIDTLKKKKKLIYHEVISIENIFLSSSPNNSVFNLTKADALMELGYYAEAKALFERFPMEGAYALQRLKGLGY